MSIIYWVVIFFGLLMAVYMVTKIQSLARQEKIIDQSNEEMSNSKLALIDYNLLIINNSKWLKKLYLVDKNVNLKLKFCGGFGLILFFLKMIGVLLLSLHTIALLLLLALMIIIVAPGMLLNMGVKTHKKRMIESVPYYIDLVAVCVQSGMTVENALRFVCEHFEDIDCNLTSLMMVVVKKAEVSGLQGGLDELYRSIDATEIRIFCSALQQSVYYGTSLYENLMEISREIRELQLLDTEEKVGSLSAKMSIPLIIFIMFPIVVLIAAPGILRIMKSAVF